MSLTELPIEIYFKIIDDLSLKDLNRLSCVNKYLSVLNQDNYIWKGRFSKDYTLPENVDYYYQYYKIKYIEIYQKELTRLRRSHSSNIVCDYKSGLFLLPSSRIILKIMDDGTLKAIGSRDNDIKPLRKVEKDFLFELNIPF